MSDAVENDASSIRAMQIAEFLQEYVMRVNKKRTKQLLEMSSTAFEAYKLSALDLDKAYQYYLDTKSLGVTANETTFSNLLSLVAGLGEQGSGQSIVRTTEPPHNIDAAFVVYEDMKQHSIPLNESNYSALIRCCSIHNRSEDALKLYNDLKSCNVTPKLRSFTPLLSTFGRDSNVAVCLQVWREMTELYKIPATEKEYNIMLRLSVSVKDKALFYEMFEAFKEDIPHPATSELTATLTDFFQTVESDFVVAHSLVTSSGIVEFNGEQLLSIDMDPETRQQLLSQLDTFAVMRDEVNRKFKPNNKIKEMIKDKKAAAAAVNSSGSGGGKPRNTEADDAARLVKWDEFKTFLTTKQFDVIVDGANVGYYKQNYVDAPKHVDYAQIDQMVRHLISVGKQPLLMLHCRHLHPGMVPDDAARTIISQWEKEGLMYSTPKGFNDDWFWMYVAVAYQCKVVTNDLMRDHHFQMLAPRWFSRWKERNQVHFEFKRSKVYSYNNLTMLNESIKDAAELVLDAPSETVVTCSVNLSGAENRGKGKRSFTYVNQAITLHWPSPYSHRVQHIVSGRYEGFYIPPPPPRTSSGAGINGTATESDYDGDAGGGGESANEDDTEGETEGYDQEETGDNDKELEDGGDEGEEEEENDEGCASELWAVFYRPVADACAGNKRNRSVDDGNASTESPDAKQAKS